MKEMRLRDVLRCCRWSMKRPGVATTISTPCRPPAQQLSQAHNRGERGGQVCERYSFGLPSADYTNVLKHDDSQNGLSSSMASF